MTDETTNQPNPIYPLLTPELYSERVPKLIQGAAIKLENNNEQALEVARWLTDNGVPAMVAPSTHDYVSTLRINDFINGEKIIWPGDWVIISRYGEATVVNHHQFMQRFHKGAFGAEKES